MGLLFDGVKLMGIGMLTVFAFLLIMIALMGSLRRMLAPFAAKEAAAAAAAKKAAPAGDASVEAAVAAAAFDAEMKK